MGMVYFLVLLNLTLPLPILAVFSEPQSAHAIIMARFAGECKIKMNEVTSMLENKLGPDTGDLCMRFGLHSGPVTAGVLRGDRARFQLFGDTVNTASRMESTGLKGHIHISPTTQQLLVEAGKSHWVKPRADAVQAKGKGKQKFNSHLAAANQCQ
jgi:class 3 adenylate cyclase